MNVSPNNRFRSSSITINIIWKFLERGSSVIVSLLINIILARLLDPSAHGLLSMVTVFVVITENFVTTGISNALVQKHDADVLDFSSMFWLNVITALLLYAILFLSAPLIAQYFGYFELTLILRVLSLRLLVYAINSVQCAYIARNMLFRHYFFSTLSGKILSGIIGITLAFAQAGVWALVAQSLSLVIIETVMLWIRVKWRPAMQFSWKRVKELYKFVYKVTLTDLLVHLSSQFKTVLIGRTYTSDALAYYNKGFLFPNCLTTNIATSLSAVMYPVLSNSQKNLAKVKNICRQWIALFGYTVFPILTGLAIVADVLVPVLLTEKWIPSIPFMRVACGIYAAWIIEVPIREAIKSIGKASVCLQMQIVKVICSLSAVLLVYQKSIYAIAYAALVCTGIHIAISIFCGWKYLGYTISEVVSDVFPSVLLCLIMAIVVWTVKQRIHHQILCLLVQIAVGIFIYVIASILTRNRNFQYCMNLVKKIRKTD